MQLVTPLFSQIEDMSNHFIRQCISTILVLVILLCCSANNLFCFENGVSLLALHSDAHGASEMHLHIDSSEHGSHCMNAETLSTFILLKARTDECFTIKTMLPPFLVPVHAQHKPARTFRWLQGSADFPLGIHVASMPYVPVLRL